MELSLAGFIENTWILTFRSFRSLIKYKVKYKAGNINLK